MDKDDLKIGIVVDYHSDIEGPITKYGCVIESKPWQLGHGQWIVSISGMSGGVSLDALSVNPKLKTKKGSCPDCGAAMTECWDHEYTWYECEQCGTEVKYMEDNL